METGNTKNIDAAKVIAEALADITIADPSIHDNMAVWPLKARREIPLDALTVEEAFQKKFLLVTEVSEGGSVPHLKVVNLALQKVLILDGEELIGAKQNRIVNATILLAEKGETIIPVSCVERGRWAYRGKTFASESRQLSADMRRKKARRVSESLRSDRAFDADQGKIWEEMDAKFATFHRSSPTDAMADLYDDLQSRVEPYLEAFKLVDRQAGMLVAIDGKVAGLEFLGRSDLFAKAFRKLTESYVMDALETANKKDGQKASEALPAQFLHDVRSAGAEAYLSIGLGEDVRLESDTLIGSALVWEGGLVHLSAFPKGEEGAGTERSRMRRASGRREGMRR